MEAAIVVIQIAATPAILIAKIVPIIQAATDVLEDACLPAPTDAIIPLPARHVVDAKGIAIQPAGILVQNIALVAAKKIVQENVHLHVIEAFVLGHVRALAVVPVADSVRLLVLEGVMVDVIRHVLEPVSAVALRLASVLAHIL